MTLNVSLSITTKIHFFLLFVAVQFIFIRRAKIRNPFVAVAITSVGVAKLTALIRANRQRRCINHQLNQNWNKNVCVRFSLSVYFSSFAFVHSAISCFSMFCFMHNILYFVFIRRAALLCECVCLIIRDCQFAYIRRVDEMLVCDVASAKPNAITYAVECCVIECMKKQQMSWVRLLLHAHSVVRSCSQAS